MKNQTLDDDLPSDIYAGEKKGDWISVDRNIDEIQAAAVELCETVWYKMHQLREKTIAEGTMKLDKDQMLCHELGRIKAKRIEAKYSAENLEFKEGYEWGRQQGKLSQLNWVLWTVVEKLP